jgi:hypothetical protein
MPLQELVRRLRPRQETELEDLKSSFVQKVNQIWEILPSLPDHKKSTTHYCELREIKWKRVDKRFLKFLQGIEIDKIWIVEVECWAYPPEKAAEFKLEFTSSIFSTELVLGFSIFGANVFHASAKPHPCRSPSFQGDAVVRLGGYKPNQQKALEFACLAVDFAKDALGGKLDAQVRPTLKNQGEE